jgi:hypothetical protein
MLETKEQKQIFAGCVVLILILSVVSFYRRNDLATPNSVTTHKQAFDYNTYLASIKTDPIASQKIFQQVITQEEVQREIEASLQVNQKITSPQIEQNKIKITVSSKTSVTSYLQTVGQMTQDFTQKSSDNSKDLFYQNEDPKKLDAAIAQNFTLLNSLYKQQVPKEAVDFHKATLTLYTAYMDTLNLAKYYSGNPQTDPWSKVYNNYSVINDSAKTINGELAKLDSKYKISSLPVYPNLAKGSSGIFSVPTASAAFGLGDTTIVIGNIPQAILQAVQQGLASSFANFATQFLNKIIASIEKNYKIANFLYYSDALVSGQYVGDYLNKYVNNTVDRAMITNFIPQFNCGQPQDIKKVLQAKADQYLGFDPETLSPQDPNFYSKMARMGDFLSSPSGWELYYQDLAQQAEAAAQTAANQELTSSGLKTPREQGGESIAASLSSITGSMQAVFNAQLNLGVVNVDKVVSQIVSTVTYNLFNNFLFKGASVYKEQNTCLPVPQLQPIVPSVPNGYQAPPPVDTQVIYNEECANSPKGCN